MMRRSIDINNKALVRFLYTGNGCEKDDGPFEVLTYNATTARNCTFLIDIIQKIDNATVVETITKVDEEGGFFNKSIILLALAACAASTNPTIASQAYEAVKNICETSENLLQFVAFCEQLCQKREEKKSTGWGRLRRRTVRQWYENKRPYDVAFSVTSCRSCNHWSHKDIWRLCHIPVDKSSSLDMKILCSYIIHGYQKTVEKYEAEAEQGSEDDKKLLNLLQALKEIRLLKPNESGSKVATLMIEHKLTWDHLPCQWHNDSSMWKHLINYLPLEIVLKNLPRLHNVKVLDNCNAWQKCVVERIMDVEEESSLHPMTYFWHRAKYEHGRHHKKKYKWIPNIEILSALDVAFYSSVKKLQQNANSTGKKIYIYVHLSPSKTYVLNSQYHLCSEVVAAWCYILLNTEEHCDIKPNSRNWDTKVTVTKEDTVASVKAKVIEQRDGSKGVDFAPPLIDAKKRNQDVDTFIFITDADRKHSGKTSPLQALSQYRRTLSNARARLVTISLGSKKLQVNENGDDNILDIAGFNDKVPGLVENFVLEKF